MSKTTDKLIEQLNYVFDDLDDDNKPLKATLTAAEWRCIRYELAQLASITQERDELKRAARIVIEAHERRGVYWNDDDETPAWETAFQSSLERDKALTHLAKLLDGGK